MSFLVLPADSYHETADSAARAVRPLWDCAQVRLAISSLAVGDELEVDEKQSVIRLSNVTKEFKPQHDQDDHTR